MANFLSDIMATTIDNRSRDIADLVSNSNAILSSLKKTGGIRTFSGGTQITELIDKGENANAGFYTGSDTLPTAATNTLEGAVFAIKQASVQVTYTGLDELMNNGREALIDALEAKMTNAERSMTNKIVQGIYSDGTGSSGKTITGLAAALTITPTTGTYGGIDRSTDTYWRNKKSKGGGVDFAGALTDQTIVGEFDKMFIRLSRGSDKPNLIVVGSTYYALLGSAARDGQQFIDTGKANLGFENLLFKGVPVIYEDATSGMGATRAYFLNTNFISFRPHSKRNFVSLGDRQPVDKDMTVHILGWAGNLTSRGVSMQGVVED